MGVDYRVWLIPTDRTFTPTTEQVVALANALRDGGWVPQPEAIEQKSSLLELLPGGDLIHRKPFLSEPFPARIVEPTWINSRRDHELVFEWWVNDAVQANVQFPFTLVPSPEFDITYFGVRIILGQEYFYWTGETVMPFSEADTQCRCGEQLAYWTGFASGLPAQRIRTQCPKCSRALDISITVAEILHPWTGESRSVAGGMAFRFALQVDAHKNFPDTEEKFRQFHLKNGIHEIWRANIAVPYETIETAD